MGRIVLGSGQRYSESVSTRGILVDPSAGSWAVELQDSTGNTVFQAGAAADAPYYAQIETDADALNMTTATNITKVIIYI